MATQTVTRCKRCGTILRNNRTVCPCCSLDIHAPEETADAGPASGEKSAVPAEKGPKKVTAKAGVKMCQICMAAVPEDQLAELNGQKICPTCAENMRNKAAKKAAAPPPQPEKK
jgi:hypothetical protein